MKEGMTSVLAARIFCAMIVLLFSCRSIVWSSSSEFYDAYWLDEERAVEAVLEYLEKYPFPPFAVSTTLKKNYITSLCSVRVRTDDTIQNCRARIEIPGQLIGGGYEIHNEFLLVLTTAEEPQIERQIVAVNLESGLARTLLKTPVEGFLIVQVIASPDRKKIAAALKNAAGEYRIVILDGPSTGAQDYLNGAVVVLRDRELQMIWGKNSDRVFIPSGDEVLELRSAAGRTTSMRAQRFPRCSYPPTANHGRISEGGRTYFRQDTDTPAVIGREKDWRSFYDLPETDSISELGAGCP